MPVSVGKTAAQMSPRERLLAALRRQEVDRIPWSPFFAYWWDFQPEQRRERGQAAYYREIGADALMRGPTSAYTCSDLLGLAEVPLGASYNLVDNLPGCTITRKTDGKQKFIEYDTPVGRVAVTLTYSQLGDTWFVTGHPIRCEEDYKTLQWLVEHMWIGPCYEVLHEQIREVGDDGLVVPLISPFLKTPFQSLIEHFVGTEKLIYDLYDFPQTVEATLAVMGQKAKSAVEISVQSRAEAFITWEDSSTTNLSPALFEKYVVPDIDAWGGIVHQAGKMLVHHACGHVRDLLPAIAREQIDAVESVSPPPTGNIEIWDAQQLLGGRVALIGGIEPVKLLTYNGDRFESYIREILDKIEGRGYILANSDSCPPAVQEEKFRRISALVAQKKLA